MTKKELRKAITEKKKAIRSKQTEVAKSNSVEECRSLGEVLDKLNDELTALEEQLDNAEDGDGSDANGERSKAPDGAEQRGGNPLNAYGVRSFAQNGGIVAPATENVTGYALRSDESMLSRVPQTERKPIDLGKYVRGAVTGDWSDAPEERSAFTTTATGVIIPQVVSAQIIDLARNTSLFTSAGVPVVPMETNNLTIARVATDPTFAFKDELAQASESDFTLDSVELKAKTAYGYAYVSLEAINSASNLSDILYRVFSQAMADCIDKGMLYGQSGATHAPAGIMNDSAINAITATNLRYNDFIKAIGAVRRENGTPTIVGINADTEEALALLCDGNGNILDEPKMFADLKKIVSNQLTADETDGSDALVFDPMAMIVGMQKNIVFRMFQDTDYCIKNGAVGFQIYAMLDSIAVRPKHIAKISGIKDITAVVE